MTAVKPDSVEDTGRQGATKVADCREAQSILFGLKQLRPHQDRQSAQKVPAEGTANTQLEVPWQEDGVVLGYCTAMVDRTL